MLFTHVTPTRRQLSKLEMYFKSKPSEASHVAGSYKCPSYFSTIKVNHPLPSQLKHISP